MIDIENVTDISVLGETPYARVKTLMKSLRNPDGGCPWDIEQTFETIAPYTIEEAYEVFDAISRGDMSDLREELGDLLFQVIFYARIAEEEGSFDLDNVCDGLTEKMVRRHPHVFQRIDGRSLEEQTRAWEVQKAEERAAKAQINNGPENGAGSGADTGILDGVAMALPALMRAQKLQKRAARVGFDWPNIDGVLAKIVEEAGEVALELSKKDATNNTAGLNNHDRLEDEIGDLLFAVVNLARWSGVDAEAALRRTNAKFTHRFTHIETSARKQSRELTQLTLDEMEALWQDAKTAV